MPKKILFESAVHQMVVATRGLLDDLKNKRDSRFEPWSACVATWKFEYLGPKKMMLRWTQPSSGERLIDYSDAQFYTRGDADAFVQKQRERSLIGVGEDNVSQGNHNFFRKESESLLSSIAGKAAN